MSVQTSSHGLLLRLLLSQYFSVNLAISYLSTYSDNIGVTWYLVRRLKEVDPRELPWQMICHLLVTRPSKSAALECFVTEYATKHTHMALMTLWMMQSYLRDERLTKNPRSFQRIQRVLHRIHEIIFADVSQATPTPYSSVSISAQVASVFGLRKIRPNAESIAVGIGMIAAAPALPNLAAKIGNIAVEQGRYDDGSEPLRSFEVNDDHDADDETANLAVSIPGIVEDPEELENGGYFPRSRAPKLSDVLGGDGNISPRGSLRRRATLAASLTTPSLALPLRPLADDPLGQQDLQPPSPTHGLSSPYMSTPSIHIQTPSAAGPSMPDKLLRSLLRSHYCRSEVDFILALESIANRLLVIPKPARVSALRAELTSLNHKLPAEVCLPLWCSSTDEVDPATKNTAPHHRVVRIPPGESVVLNSAERAPYVLLVEVLGDDLSFDPTRRENKETLKRVIVKEAKDFQQSKKPSLDVTGWTNDAMVNSAARSALSPEITAEEPSSVSTNGSDAPPSDDEEEVDLVEQLYGPGLSIRDEPLDLADSLVLPAPPKNKDLDIAAWSRSPSIPPSPQPGHSYSVSFSPASTPRTTQWKQHSRVVSSPPSTSNLDLPPIPTPTSGVRAPLSLEDYSERMRTAAVMLAQLNATLMAHPVATHATATPILGSDSPDPSGSGALSWLPGTGWIRGSVEGATSRGPIQRAEAEAIRNRIMQEMMTLEDERMERMKGGEAVTSGVGDSLAKAEDEGIIRRELNKLDPSATVFRESWAGKKARIRANSPYGHLANWDVISVIVKTGADLRQEQLALLLIQELDTIWKEEKCLCWLRPFKILITGGSSGLVETITDAVSVHSIKKAEYARRLGDGNLGYVTLADHFNNSYGDPSSAKYARAQRNFAKSLAGYSLVTYFLQLRDRHNGNILIDTAGHVAHIDFGFMLGNSPGNVGVEAAPFKFTAEYLEVLGGIDSPHFAEFKRLFHEGFEIARRSCDRIVSIVELMQKDSAMPCFAPYGEQTAQHMRDRFQPVLKNNMTMADHIERLIVSSLGSSWTRLYDSYQYYSQSIL
ncbi:kinase-like protein [Auricularia subglabra TFB-10046 SS5]|nr:kinase-like protein [Auricularia subglabra TFB-10046 SS5]